MMHASRAAMTAAFVLGSCDLVLAAPLKPDEIKSTFFNGQPFTASTPKNIQYKMVFTADGKVTREPLGKAGVKGDGTWKTSKDGFCTAWKGSAANCFQLVPGNNAWSVMKGKETIATWTK
jgi:hypothetical protein